MNTDKKLKFYQLRSEGHSQKAAAAALGVSTRTCRRWEREARSITQQEAENAKRLYSAQLVDQNKSTLAIYAMLESSVTSIDFSSMSDRAKLELLLKYGRRVDELENKPHAMPEEMKLNGLEKVTQDEGNLTILEMQQRLYNMAAAGEITDEQARKKIALLSELRKSVAAADSWG